MPHPIQVSSPVSRSLTLSSDLLSEQRAPSSSSSCSLLSSSSSSSPSSSLSPSRPLFILILLISLSFLPIPSLASHPPSPSCISLLSSSSSHPSCSPPSHFIPPQTPSSCPPSTSLSNENTSDELLLLLKRQDPPNTSTRPRASSTPRPSRAMPTTAATPSATASAVATPINTHLSDAKGDMALFGMPSVVGEYNLTSGIVIYMVFLILFVGAVGSATFQRSRYRNQFRMQQKLMESGRVSPSAGGGAGGGQKGRSGSKNNDTELSDAALFRQASMSKQALMKDVGPGGVLAANEAIKTKIAAANSANGRGGYDDSNSGTAQQVRFGAAGDSAPSTGTGTGRTGGMKKPRAPQQQYGQYNDPLNYYQDNQDTTDYSRPPLTESTDPYYSSGSSNGNGYLDQAEEYQFSTNPNSHGNNALGRSGSKDGSNNYTSPQMPRATYQQQQGQHSSQTTIASPQPQYQQPVFIQRTNSSRMPQQELHDGNNIFRSNSGRNTPASGRGIERTGSNPRMDRSGSNGGSRTQSPHPQVSRTGSNASSGRTRVSPSPSSAQQRDYSDSSSQQRHPTPIARSNSTRLPPQMRGGTPQPSSLSQRADNNYGDYM